MRGRSRVCRVAIFDYAVFAGGVRRFTLAMLDAWLKQTTPGQFQFTLFWPAADTAGHKLNLPFTVPSAHLTLCTIPEEVRRGTGLHWLARQNEEYDVVYCPSMVHQLSAAYELRLGVPLVATLHDLAHEFTEAWGPWTPQVRLEMRQWSHVADAVIFSSDYIRNEAIRLYGIPSDKTHRVYLAPPLVDKEKQPHSVDVADWRMRYGLPERFALSPGTAMVHKNPLVVIEAFGRLKHEDRGLPLVLIGPLVEHLIPGTRTPATSTYHLAVQRRIVELDLRIGRDLFVLGHIPDAELPVCYAAADLVVTASQSEAGLSGPVLEGMWYRRPVVCSTIPQFIERLGTDERLVYLFDPRDPESLSRAVCRWADDRCGAARRVAEAHTWISQRCWGDAAREYLDIFNKIIEKRKVHPLRQEKAAAPASLQERPAPNVVARERPASISMRWVAPAFGFSGYSWLSRHALRSLVRSGITVQLVPLSPDPQFLATIERQPAETAFWQRLIDTQVDGGVCVFLHPPVSWRGDDFFGHFRSQHPGFEAHVGLTMFETDRLPQGWMPVCNRMDEIWVPSTFNRETFTRAGVEPDRLQVVPFGIDVGAYDPAGVVPMTIQGRRSFTFLSVFQWNKRKGWDILLKAYLSAFSGRDDVCLVLRTYPDSIKTPPIRERVAQFVRQLGHDSNCRPPIIVIDDFISEQQMPALFAAADAFVLPTRGEGWGIPFMEAMAMGLPVIGTRWSSHLDFMDDRNSYLIDVVGLAPVSMEQTSENPFYTSDQQWAEPSVEHTATLMRHVYEQRNEAKRIGRIARECIVERFDMNVAARSILPRLQAIARRGGRKTAHGMSGLEGQVGAVEERRRASRSSTRGLGERVRVLFVNRPDALRIPGGDTEHMLQLKAGLERLGVQVDISCDLDPDPTGYDLVNVFNLLLPRITLRQLRSIRERSNLPIVLTPFFWDRSEALWGEAAVPHAVATASTPHALEQALHQIAVGTYRVSHLTRSGPNTPYAECETEQRECLRHVDHVIPISARERSILTASFDLSAIGSMVVPTGVSLLDKSASPDSFVAQYGVKDFVLITGRVETRKNQLMLLMALRETGLPIVIAGAQVDAGYLALCRTVAPPDTHIVGRLDQEMLRSARAAARVHALPSWWECAGIASMEAALAGCSVVMGNHGAEPEYFGTDAYYCRPSDVISIRQAVVSAYTHYEADAECRMALTKRIRADYSWQTVAMRTLEVYRGVIASKTHAGRPSVTTKNHGANRQSAEDLPLPEAALEHLRVAELSLANGDFETVCQRLTEAVSLAPYNPELIIMLGHVKQRLGDVEAARCEFTKATALQPECAPAHADLAATLLHLGRTAEAETSARKAIELDSTNVSALKVLAKVCLDTERYQEAVRAYATILEHAPDDIETLILVGNCYAETGRSEDAKRVYRRVLQLDPGNTIATENLTVVGGQTPGSDQIDAGGREASKRKSVQVSIIIPVYNRLDLTRQCLEAVRCNTPAGQYELIVVDNGSSDGAAEFLRREQDAGRLRVIPNRENGGFARACNQGARAATGSYLLFLNNDTEVRPGWFDPLVAVLNTDPAVGAAGSKLLFPNGAIQHAGVIVIDQQQGQEGLIATHIYYRKMVDPSKVNQSMTYQVLTAACLLIRRGAFEQVGGFDEQYWNGYEDVDLCFKLQELGWLLVYEPKSVVIHYDAQSGVERVRQKRNNVERLKRKWTGRITADLVVRPDGSCADTGANRIRPYRSPAHSTEDAAVGDRVPLPRDRESTDPLLIRGEKASSESGAVDKATEALRCAEAYIKDENLDAAERVLTEAIALDQGNPDLIVALGHVAWKQSDLEKACLQFVRAATLEPNHVQAHAALAILFLQQSQFAEAEEAARKALALDATEITALKVLAKVCLDTERYQEAVQAYATILEHAPDDIETLILVGNCYAETGRFEQARSFYRKVLALDPTNAIAKDNLMLLDGKEPASDACEVQEADCETPLTPHPSPLTSVIIVTYNSASTIRACLDSVLRESRPATEVIVVDNVSTDATRAILDTYRDRATVILNSDNVGFSAGCNQGIRASTGEYVVLLNPDTVVTSGWLDRLIAHIGPGVGAVGPVSDYAAGIQNLDRNLLAGASRRMGLDEVSNLLSRVNASKGVETKLLIGFCLMVPRKVLDEVGLLDEELFLGNDDLDLSWRLRLKGYKLLVAADTFVYHEGQVSFKSEATSKTSRLVQESTDRLYAKLEAHYGPGNVPSPMELWDIDWFKPTRLTPHASRLTSIIILTHNGLEHTKKCLASIKACTPEPHELIIVDNGSTDGTLDYLRDYMATHDNVRVIANRTNRGFAAGNNQGMALAQGDYVLLLNNDTIVTPGWLGRMVSHFDRHPEVGIVGPMSNYGLDPQLVRDASYKGPEGLEAFSAQWARIHDGQGSDATRVVGFCLLVRREVVARIGGLDERFGSGNFEDDDFCIRAFQAGYRARIAVDAFIHHTGSQTFRAAKIDYRGSLMRNWGLFKAKWGIPADAPYEQGYHFPPPSAPSVPLSVPLPDIGADHRCELSERWWQEIDGDHGRCEPAVAGETRCSAIIIPNGQGIAPLWSSLVQHTNQPLAITIVPSTVGNGNVGELPGTSCPDGWQIGTADVPAVQLLNRLLQSAGDKPVILLSGEVVVTPGWLKRLLTACDRNPHLAMVGPAMNDGPVPQQVKADYKGTGKALRQFALRRAHRFGKQLAATDHLAPSCIVLNPVVCRAIGSLREDLDLAASLADFSVRVREAGRPVAVALDTYVHCGQSTAACCH